MTKPYRAVCPDCEKSWDLAAMPEGRWWPYCNDCAQPLNIYRTVPQGRDDGEGAARCGKED